jgi:putative DNA primase/helicase
MDDMRQEKRPDSGNVEAPKDKDDRKVDRSVKRSAGEVYRGGGGDWWQENPDNWIDCYTYLDKNGKPYHEIRKFVRVLDNGEKEKAFPQYHFVERCITEARRSSWELGAPKKGPIPYNLPALIKAASDLPLHWSESEKDADTLCRFKLLASSRPGGAHIYWDHKLDKYLRKHKCVVIHEHNDAPGEFQANLVARAFAAIDCEDIRIVRYHDMPEGGDVSDWLAAGHTKEELLARIEATERWVDRPLDPEDPMSSAGKMVEDMFSDGELHTAWRYRNEFVLWTGSHYRAVDDELIYSEIWKFLARAQKATKSKGGEEIAVPFKPRKSHVTNVFDALGALTQLDSNHEAPLWLEQEMNLPAREFFAAANGLLHLPTRKLYPPTPAYFGFAASEVEFDAKAPVPKLWLAYLDQVLVDKEAIATLQEWFGYMLVTDTTQQKMLLCVGPKRSGKGTMARVLSALVGRNSVAGPTMSSLGERFGLEPLITKPVAITSDARIGRKTDKSMITERLLSISGEDTLTVDRKFKPAWNGRLPTRFTILTNELMALADTSGALVSRFIVLLFPSSFYGREDPGLTDRLLEELPGIAKWAIDGYMRLRKRGHFVQPANASEAIEDMETLSAPIKGFVRDRCEIGARYEIDSDALFVEYQEWCRQQGISPHTTKDWFSRELMTATEKRVKTAKPRAKPGRDERIRVYKGIKLRPRPM